MPDKMEPMNAFGGNSGDNAITDSDLTYDKKFKQLLSNKKFLTPILKNVIPEYKELRLEAIEKMIVFSGKRGDNVTVNPMVYSSGDSGKGDETAISYDVLVGCKLPNKKERVYTNIFFDLEMQRKNNPGYSIPKRGVYYCCRLISRQIEILGEKYYDQLIPVYSVWILVNGIPKDLENSVYTAGLAGGFNDAGKDTLKNAIEIGRQIDLINLCLIYLSKDFKVEEGQNDLVKYLQSVFTRKVDEKCNPYCEYSIGIKKEVDEMMSLRESFELRGEQRGIARVIKLLLKLGKTDDEIVQYLMEDDNPLTEEQALNAVKSYHEREVRG